MGKKWFVKLGRKKFVLTSSRRKAKIFCLNYSGDAWFQKQASKNFHWFDVIIWRKTYSGGFFKYIHVDKNPSFPTGKINTWIAGGQKALEQGGFYPKNLIEVTLDSSESMICAQFEFICSFESMIEAIKNLGLIPNEHKMYGTVEDGRLLLWEEIQSSDYSSGDSSVLSESGTTAR